jgi:hypothetical protein
MAVATKQSRTLVGAYIAGNGIVAALTSDDASANRPHRYNQLEIEVCSPSAGDPAVVSRPSPDNSVTPATFTALAAWSALRIADDVTIDTAALSWAT